MIDIDYILGNSKKSKAKDPLRDLFGIKPSHQAKPKSNVVNQDFMKLFIGQGHPRPNDRKTKQQTAFLKRTAIGTGRSHERFWNLDGDGVISGLDCEYKNPKKHMPRVYHATHNYAIDGIREKGVLPHKDTAKNLDENDDYGRYKEYSYWSTDEKAARKYGKILLSTEITDEEAAEGERLSKERMSYEELRVPGEVLVKGRVPPEKLRFENYPRYKVGQNLNDSNEHTDLPPEYKNPVKQNLPSFIQKKEEDDEDEK